MPLNSYAALSPVNYLRRAAQIFADRTAIIDGDRTFSYRDFSDRSQALTGTLAAYDVDPGDRVAALCSNSHVMLELHHAVPLRGAVLVPLNVRLSLPELAYILEHSGAKLLVATREFAAIAARLCSELQISLLRADEDSYEAELSTARPAIVALDDERSMLAINYTSGTTGRPKGVMYHHRGAYLQALAMAYHVGLRPGSTYLWALPMYHCNGWCFPWAVTAAGATHMCLRTVDPSVIWQRLRQGVTHLSAAPTVLTMIAEHAAARKGALTQPVDISTGGAPPSPSLLRRMASLNIRVTHLYGLTETFGPVIVNQWQPEWFALDEQSTAEKQARQGVPNIIASVARVVDPEGVDVEPDGQAVGEILIRGNNLMLGYYRDEMATAAASVDGWFRTGDLGVMHPDGYLEVRDRLKDIIISGGENIASVEVERVLDSHPAVIECAVVGMPDEHWGEVPVAFVTVREGVTVTTDELVAYAREHLARFKVPKRVVFTSLPRTSTGKIQKNVLRSMTDSSGGVYG